MLDFFKKLLQRKPKVNKVDLSRRFELIGRIGQGSMSKVWRSRDYGNNRVVAVKVLDKEKTKRLESRFIGMEKPSEGEIAMQLKHPNLARTLEHGITLDDEQYLVMEFIEGVSLSYLVDVQNERMCKYCLSYMIQLGEALDFLHNQNFIHRDVCPRNVVITEEERCVLIDFGLVVPNTPRFQAPGNRTGTANYMAPELIKRQKTDPRIDVFSYAVTCYEMCCRHLPWPAADSFESVLQHLNSPPDDIKQYAPKLDSQVAETIMKGLTSHPDDRWNTAREMVDQFREAAIRTGVPAGPTE